MKVKKGRDYFKGTFLLNDEDILYNVVDFNYKSFQKANRTEDEKTQVLVSENKSILTCSLL